MFTKKITPIIINKQQGLSDAVVGTTVEYRLLGILLYKKELFLPSYYGIKEYEFQISI
ncbi:MAG: hypothetical protein WCS17_04075 [Prevotella sp.]